MNDLITGLNNGVNAANSHAYEYDELARMSKDTIGGAQVNVDVFDAVGNRTSRTSRTSTVSGVNTLTQYPMAPNSNRVQGQVGNANRNFSYAPQGHLLSSTGWLGNRTYAYDAFDRLKSISIDGAPTSYLTNAQDQRVGKTTGGVNTRFVYVKGSGSFIPSNRRQLDDDNRQQPEDGENDEKDPMQHRPLRVRVRRDRRRSGSAQAGREHHAGDRYDQSPT